MAATGPRCDEARINAIHALLGRVESELGLRISPQVPPIPRLDAILLAAQVRLIDVVDYARLWKLRELLAAAAARGEPASVQRCG